MNVLVACERWGKVRDAFTALGHYAVSCDVLPTEKPGKHYEGDVKDILSGCYECKCGNIFTLDYGKYGCCERAAKLIEWDLLIGFPPCTYLSNVNTKWRKDIERLKQACKAMEFFADLFSAPIEKIALENPVGMLSTCFRKPDQIISPVYFGGSEQKNTCLWLKNLPLLVHAKEDTLFYEKTHGVLSELFATKNEAGQSNWYNNRKGERSITFNSVAAAMAEQWGNV